MEENALKKFTVAKAAIRAIPIPPEICHAATFCELRMMNSPSLPMNISCWAITPNSVQTAGSGEPFPAGTSWEKPFSSSGHCPAAGAWQTAGERMMSPPGKVSVEPSPPCICSKNQEKALC